MFLLAFTLGLHTGTWGFVFVCTVFLDSHRWQAGLRERWRGLLEQGAELVLGPESDCYY